MFDFQRANGKDPQGELEHNTEDGMVTPAVTWWQWWFSRVAMMDSPALASAGFQGPWCIWRL